MRGAIATIGAVLLLSGLCAGPVAAQVRIPTVGCPMGGMIDAVPAPPVGEIEVDVDRKSATSLALYRAKDGPAVLAPRGWRCYTTIGSSSIMIRVEPDPQGFPTGAVAGPGVVSIFFFAGTSGRHQVADIDAMLFHDRTAFLQMVTGFEEEIDLHVNRKTSPPADDTITPVKPDLVAFETRAGGEGLGRYAGFLRAASVVRGLVKNCGDEDGVYVLAARLPATPDLLRAVTAPPGDELLQCMDKEISGLGASAG